MRMLINKLYTVDFDQLQMKRCFGPRALAQPSPPNIHMEGLVNLALGGLG